MVLALAGDSTITSRRNPSGAVFFEEVATVEQCDGKEGCCANQGGVLGVAVVRKACLEPRPDLI